MTGGQAAFFVMAIVAVASAIGVVAFKSPVRSAVSLVLTFFTLAMLYFNLGAQFLGITQIMVYAGAIMVLFLFVIMLLKLGGQERDTERRDMRVLPAIGVAFIIAAVVAQRIILPLADGPASKIADNYGTPQMIGTELFTTFVWPFEVASVLLLVGVVGSIMLAKRKF